jgi:phosphoribosylamine---glycine ligase
LLKSLTLSAVTGISRAFIGLFSEARLVIFQEDWMRVLIVGSGGREHALAWKLRQSPECTGLFIWPGNPASLRVSTSLGLPGDASFERVADAALSHGIEMVVVGPEGPLSAGIADVMTKKGLRVFGPNQAAAQLESSKVFAKQMMVEASIPTAAFEVTRSRGDCLSTAMRILNRDGGVVLKASGLASGKGVFVCQSESEVLKGIERLFGASLRSAADEVVVEEMLFGREVSYFCFIGNGHVTRIGFAVDHKRLLPGDKGPMTGGMGCYTPVPWLPGDAGDQVDRSVVHPLLEVLASKGMSYTGCLYVGIMWSDKGPSVIEFNVRFGDPEAQVLAFSDSTDWLPLMAATVGLNLKKSYQSVAPKSVMGYVLASSGYPYGETPDIDAVIPWSLLEQNSDQRPDHSRDGAIVFCGSVSPSEGGVRTGSGRVFLVAGSGRTFKAAKAKALACIDSIRGRWPQTQWRADIGQTALQYEEAVLSSVSRLPIVLGSSSPRRRELLGHLGLEFIIIKPETEEKPLPGENSVDYVARNAREKGQWIGHQVKQTHPDGALVISADTIVVVDDKLLEKPLNPTEAKDMLSLLSGKTHTVYTAVRIAKVSAAGEDKVKEFTTATSVLIKPLSGAEMDGYIETGEPFDKAGGYAAQGLGSFMVQEIHGSFSNVVGLPLAELGDALQKDFGIPLWRDR